MFQVDFGIVSLLVIQLAAVMGSFAVYIRSRAQTERIIAERGHGREDVLRCEEETRKLRAILSEHGEAVGRVDKLCKSLVEREAGAEAAMAEALAELDAVKDRIASMQGSIAALSRKRGQKASVEQMDLVHTAEMSPKFSPFQPGEEGYEEAMSGGGSEEEPGLPFGKIPGQR